MTIMHAYGLTEEEHLEPLDKGKLDKEATRQPLTLKEKLAIKISTREKRQTLTQQTKPARQDSESIESLNSDSVFRSIIEKGKDSKIIEQ